MKSFPLLSSKISLAAILTILIFQATTSLLFSQSFKLDTLKDGGNYYFPVVDISENAEASRKINQYLQIKLLHQLPKSYKNSDPFYYARNNNQCGQTIFQGFSGENVNASILKISIDIEQSYCTGMGLDWYLNQYYFDINTGEAIQLEDLLSIDKQEGFKAKIVQLFQDELRGYLGQIEKDIQQAEDADEKLFYQEQYDFYQECLENTDVGDFRYYTYRFSDSTITVNRNKCYWNETGRALAEKPNPKAIIGGPELLPYLSGYGKYLYGYSQKTSTKGRLVNKHLKGTIGGKYPIEAFVQRYDERIEIFYWYNSTKQLLQWKGKMNEKLSESVYAEDNDKEIAQVLLNFTQNKGKWQASGSWMGSNGKTYTIDLVEE